MKFAAVKQIWSKNRIFHSNEVAGLQEYSLLTFLPASQDAGNRITHVPVFMSPFVEFM
jgi:hypothetical protein